MTETSQNQDVSVRGGIVNVPHSTTQSPPPRHQPNTPRTKKYTKTRPDHIPAATDPTPTAPEQPARSATPDQTNPDEPETDSPD